jgi:hypothetical protein
LLAEFLRLCRDRSVPVAATPLCAPCESPAPALAGRRGLDKPCASTGCAPVVGKSEKVQGPRCGPCGATRSPACPQAGLLRGERQSGLPAALGEHPAHPLCLLSGLTAHARVVRKPEEKRPTAQAWRHLLRDPLVEAIMQRQVPEQRCERPPLRQPGGRRGPHVRRESPRLEPLVEQSCAPPLAPPVREKRPQMRRRQGGEKLGAIQVQEPLAPTRPALAPEGPQRPMGGSPRSTPRRTVATSLRSNGGQKQRHGALQPLVFRGGPPTRPGVWARPCGARPAAYRRRNGGP